MHAWKASLLFTLAAGAATYALYSLAQWPFGAPQLAVLAFLGALTAVLLAWQEKAMAADPNGFMHRFMLGLVIKMLASLLAVAVILIALPRENAVLLVLTFAVLYLAFLAFSTVRLSGRSRNQSRP